MLKKKYQAQILLIVLLVIFVATIVLIGVQSRNRSSTQSTINDRTSAEAIATLNTLLDDLSVYNVLDLEKIIGDKTTFIEDWSNNSKEITELLTSIGATIPFSGGGNCGLNLGDNRYVLNIFPANDQTAYFITSGQSWSMPINNAFQSDSTCQLHLWMEQKESKTGFIVYKTYANYDKKDKLSFVEYKNFDYGEDSLNYCFTDGRSGNCENENFHGSWIPYTSGDQTTIPAIYLAETVKDVEGVQYQLEKVTVKAINGRVGILYSMTDENGKDCSDGFRILKFSLDVYCNGSFSGKDVLVPEWGWYEPLFDYTFYNGAGTMGTDYNI